MSVRLLKADPHRWGVGLVHQIDPENGDRLMCGKTPHNCPGDAYEGQPREIGCKLCLRAMESRERAAARTEEAEMDVRRRQLYADEWWRQYHHYLRSPHWADVRGRVLRRAGNFCEGCGTNRATQVHHLRYPPRCLPGDRTWIEQQKLFDLRAVCDRCHDEIHRMRAA